LSISLERRVSRCFLSPGQCFNLGIEARSPRCRHGGVVSFFDYVGPTFDWSKPQSH